MEYVVLKIMLLMLVMMACIFIIYHQLNVGKPVVNTLTYHPFVPPYANIMLVAGLIGLSFFVDSMLKSVQLTMSCAPIMLLVGYLWGIWMYNNEVVRFALGTLQMPANKIIYIYLPTALFSLCFCMDVPIFLKTFPQVTVIGVPVAMLTAVIFGLMSKFIVNVKWDLTLGIVFGMLCLPMYPKPVTKILKHQSMRTRQISVLLEGEGVFSILVTDIFYVILYGCFQRYVTQWYQIVAVLLRIVLGGLIIGYFAGLLGRYLIRKLSNCKLSVYVVCLAFPYLLFVLTHRLSLCGSVAVVVLGFMMGTERAVLAKEVENFLMEIWDLFTFFIHVYLSSVFSMYTACYVSPSLQISDYALILGTYLLYVVTRLISFLLFSPIISKFGYGMDLRNLFVCVWGSLKCPYNGLLILLLDMFNFEKDNHKSIFYILGLNLFSNLINGAFTGRVLDFLDLNKISTARQVNMTMCMKHIYAKKEKTLTLLKMDKFLADTNWLLIMEATNIKHPYLSSMDAEDDDSFTVGHHYTYCSDCMKEVSLEPTGKELKDMMREANMKVLKAKKMSYTRQFGNGMISKEGIRILSQAVEMAMDSNTAQIEIEDLYKRFTEETWLQQFVRKEAEKVYKRKSSIRPPRTYWRRKCYHIVMHRYFNKIMLAIVAVHCVFLGFDYYYHPSVFDLRQLYHDRSFDYVMAVVNLIFAVIYTLEVWAKILAYSYKYICTHGCFTYFRTFWNIVNFFLMITAWCSFERNANELSKAEESVDSYRTHYYHQFVDICELLRAFRLLRVFATFYDDLLRYLDATAESRMAFTYELGKSYATGEAEILDMLPFMISNQHMRNDIKKKIEKDKVTITKLLGMVQKERPWIAITVKTRQAIRTILNGMGESIKFLKSGGWVDSYEYDVLLASMNELYKNVNTIEKVQPSPPKVIFKEVAWMAQDQAVIDFLFENVTARSFEPGEVVFDEGTVANAIYIIVIGLFQISYTPNPHILNSTKLYGQLPISDYHAGTKYDEPGEDYIVSGNCIGEHSILTLRPYNCTITADTHSRAYALSVGVLRMAMDMSPDSVTGLECRIWKEVGVRIALPLLMTVPAYQSLSLEQLKLLLERAFVPNLSMFKIFTVTEVIEQVVLIEGMAADLNTDTMYIAPCCIPRTVQKLVLPTSSLIHIPVDVETKLLIIPIKDMDEYDVMLAAESTCELVTVESRKCLQHTIKDKIKNRKRRKLQSLKRGRSRRMSTQSGTSTKRMSTTSYLMHSTPSNEQSEYMSAEMENDEVQDDEMKEPPEFKKKPTQPSKMFLV